MSTDNPGWIDEGRAGFVKIRAVRHPLAPYVSLYARLVDRHRGQRVRVKRIELELIEDGSLTWDDQGFMQLEDPEAQHLMNDLWAMGFRPDAMKEPGANQVKAMGDHIEDLRRVAFKLLKIEE